MSKSRLTFALCGLLAAGSAFAMPMRPMAPPSPGCHPAMHRRFFRHGMIPMVLPLAEMRSYSLHMSDHQVSVLAVWHNRHMRVAVPLMRRLRTDKRALHKALLQGASASAVHELVDHVDRDRAGLLDLAVAQVRIVRKTLTTDQWHKLMRLYHHMPPMRFMMRYR
ncbi:hypothetical protein [Acidiferrobacter sp.]|uniref:hypothetical protein n=1 Tax=Acidiferrobacter sp. TaxID=1872107 RepID=UPI00261C3786|nr:hypothetical protein [Acidiferrobacter sp.]